jgi:hypothetical protein
MSRGQERGSGRAQNKGQRGHRGGARTPQQMQGFIPATPDLASISPHLSHIAASSVMLRSPHEAPLSFAPTPPPSQYLTTHPRTPLPGTPFPREQFRGGAIIADHGVMTPRPEAIAQPATLSNLALYVASRTMGLSERDKTYIFTILSELAIVSTNFASPQIP